MTNAKTPLEMLAILRSAQAFATDNAIAGVHVYRSQSAVFFTGASKANLLKLKAATGKFLQTEYASRKFRHFRYDGRKVSRTTYQDFRAGITIDLLDSERLSVILGPVAGINCR